VPCRVEAFQCPLLLRWGFVLFVRLLDAGNGVFGLVCGDVLNEKCDEEVAWDREVEDEAVDDVLPSVVMAADVDEDAILLILALHWQIDVKSSLF
jgi:hypothetical protein